MLYPPVGDESPVQISPAWAGVGVHTPSPASPRAGDRETGIARGTKRPAARVNPEQITIRRARIGDMQQVEPLINRFARKNLMLPKTSDQLSRFFREFIIALDADEQVIGCGALRVYNPVLAEIASLAVDERAHGLGVGRRLVEKLLGEAREMQLSTVFALTLQQDFFHRLGFRTVPKESFPSKVWADCRQCPKLHACDEIAVAREV